MIYAGVAQREQHRRSTVKVDGSTPSPRSTLLRVFADGFGLVDRDAFDLGYGDGARRAFHPPEGADLLSYALGFHQGELYG
jgi:hypothetical protein